MLLMFVLLLIPAMIVQAKIQVICTAALADSYYEFRKQQYIDAFTILAQYGYSNVFIVEALKKHGPTFLEDYSTHVFYATRNNPSLKNQGINEAITLLEACEHFNFDPEDMIIKFTGRHKLISDYFLKIVENNPEFDAFVKVNEDENVFTLGFAMRYKYLKEMYETIDYSDLNEKMIPIEYRIGDYIKWKKKTANFKVYYLDKLGMTANLLGSTTAPGTPEQIFFY
jgi:hypothetical protein